MSKESFIRSLQERILILDGGMGTMIQSFKLTEADYRGERFASFPTVLKGNNDILCLTRPDVIASIHRQYLEAGADIFATNTFNANSVSMEDYGMGEYVREINLSAGRLARGVADEFMRDNPGREVFVAGSVGPTNKTASMSPDVSNPAYRAVTYKDLYRAYREQVEALVEGGVDIILFETTFDTLNAKAGLRAAEDVLRESGADLPIMLSLTLSAQGGRTLSGQTLDAFLASVSHTNIVSVGLNCSFGAEDMKPYLADLARKAPYFISAYPNAGLPNTFGTYDETPEKMARHVKPFVDEGLVNILGGCCGTTPQHIALFPSLVKGAKPHVRAAKADCLSLSGLELLEVKKENNFVTIGERCNVAGSRRFLRLIKEENYEEALTVARRQVEDGAQIIDINMDDGMLDAVREMTTFLNLIASEPDIARVPVMIDSSRWQVIEEGLMCVQGRSVVNSISLKEGEEVFLERATRVKQLGAAVVVMAFDEKGQADTFERKVEVCSRAYHLLREKVDFDPNGIIFDPNVLAIATGMEEHDGYALDFIRAVEWIKKHLPGARVSGGISNLSFSFRGNNYVREAMHAVFLYHAIRAGLDMGIVNPSSTLQYEDIEPELRVLLEDVILCRREGASEDLIRWAASHAEEKQKAAGQNPHTQEDRNLPVGQRLENALVKGIGDHLEEDLQEALGIFNRPVDIIDGPLMSGMNRVGELFGAGKMFLPQVVKTARTMKKAVSLLQPAIERDKAARGAKKAGKVVFATVKGDVHDIGKNIVSIVLACNNYEVIDLGVMVPAEVIVETARREKPDLVCLSGLITPSLEEMVHVTDEMQKAGLTIPIMVGGATTSKLHTALKIAPHYDYPVIHVLDASQNPIIAARLLSPDTRDAFVESLNREYEALRNEKEAVKPALAPLAEARRNAVTLRHADYVPTAPRVMGVQVIPFVPIEAVTPYINWTYFFTTWKLSGQFASVARLDGCEACRRRWIESFSEDERTKAEEAMRLYADAERMLCRLEAMKADYCRAVYGIFPAERDGDNIRVGGKVIPMLRQQTASAEGVYKSLADYILPRGSGKQDYAGVFAVTAGVGAEKLLAQYKEEGDSYSEVLLRTLTDRLAEALSEYLHEKVRREYWGYAPAEGLSMEEMFKSHYQGIRPAVGYPSLPDQRLIETLDSLIDLSQIGVKVTENGAMYPTASICGLYLAHPEAHYFMIGGIDETQLADYASRRGIPTDEARRLLVKNIL